jgi:hypothetical protein
MKWQVFTKLRPETESQNSGDQGLRNYQMRRSPVIGNERPLY